MKKWTQRDARTGGTVSPPSLNDELSSARESMTALDRHQLPAACVDDAVLVDAAMHKVWASDQFPGVSGQEGEQVAVRDSDVFGRSWISLTPQGYAGGWVSIGASTTLDGFKGGNLFIEWSGNGYVYNAFAQGLHAPRMPRYLGLRIVVAGQVIAERRGCAYHETFRIFGTASLPPGDHIVEYQFKVTPIGPDDAVEDTTANHIPQAHIWGSKFFAIGRWR
jgi:hypothetical protein